jgi:LCP family protein required for cell wall assembly
VAPTPASWRVFRRRFLVACAAALVLMVASIVVLNVKVDQTLADTQRIGNLTFPDGPAEGGNYLIIGSDSRAFVQDSAQAQAFGTADQSGVGGQRSDTMMVLHIDPSTKSNLLVSFPRDLLVTDAAGRRIQINSVFNSGPQAVIDMMKRDFDLDINHYVEINFEAFIGVVNAVGKIPVYFPYPARDTYSGLNIGFPGCQALDGNAALAYVRSRHLQYERNGRWTDASPRADLDRITRQQDFIRKLASYASAKAGQNPLDALDIANAIVPKLKIDDQLSKDNILRLVKTFRNVDPTQEGALEMVTLPNVASTSESGRLDVQQPEADQLLARLRTFGGDAAQQKDVREADVVVSVLNGSDKAGEAGKTIAKLQLRGFGPGVVGNAPATPETLVRYAPGAQAKAELVARYLGGTGQLEADPSVRGVDVVLVIGADWRGVHGKDTTAKAPPTTTTTGAKTSSTTAGGDASNAGAAAAC